MRNVNAEWFEVKISYEKIQDDGTQRKVTEAYVVDAMSYTEAESTIIDQMSNYITGEFKIKDIKQATYRDVFFSDKTTDDYWFKVKVKYITLDEKTAKEKYSMVTYLFQAHTLQLAVGYAENALDKGLADYKISNVSETPIMDVFEHENISRNLRKLENGNADDDIVEYEAANLNDNEE